MTPDEQVQRLAWKAHAEQTELPVDVDALYRELRELLRELTAAADTGDRLERVLELWKRLDLYLRDYGYVPSAWQGVRKRPWITSPTPE